MENEPIDHMTSSVLEEPFPANISGQWRESWNPKRNSMALTSTKGLLNPAGENNCFLNCAVQVRLIVCRVNNYVNNGHSS